MKQKYKVFINDQEIVFQYKKSIDPSNPADSLTDLSPEKVYKKFANNNSLSSTYVVESDDPETEFTNFVNQFKMIEAAGGIVRKAKAEEELLVIFRLGKWDLPKGKIDKDETPEIASVREVEEECGISGLTITEKVAETFHIYQLKKKVVIKKTHWFAMITSAENTPVPQQNEGIEQVRWVDRTQLLKLLPQTYASIKSLLSDKILHI